MLATPLDAEVTALAHRIAELGKAHRAPVVQSSWWSERMLEWAMSHPSFKTQLFRFVDVFPATTDDADVLRHLDEYFEGADVPKVLDLGLDVADHLPFGKAAAAGLARRNITRGAEQFIVGRGPHEAAAGLHQLWRRGSAFTVDDPDALIRELEATGRFRRDTRIGRLFHRGKVSLREVAPTHSLHITLGEGNRVSAHVDRYSPLAPSQPEEGCRYSLARIAAHNVAGIAGDLRRLAPRRRGSQACTAVDEPRQ